MKMPISKKILAAAGAAMAIVGDSLAYYFNTATHEETVGFLTYEVLTYDADYVTGALALAIIGAVVLLMAALVES
ncbi:MAG TPA: hypothetical protein PLQ92_01595 [Methanomassiliicoccales archaeon]|nr:hypothetical protein [Methanomassiliicoccales archaeon]